MKVVLDTNVIVISLSQSSKYHLIFRKLMQKEYELIISNEIFLEYYEIIQKKYSQKTLDLFLAYLQNARNIIKIESNFKWDLMKNDQDDNKFVDSAISANVDFIVTDDKHFDILRSIDFPKVKVISSDEFLDLLSGK